MLSYLIDLKAIILAIGISAPNMNLNSATYYAKIIQKEAVRTETSPLIGIAIINHESRWNPHQISKDQLDFGLMQVRARYTQHPEYLLDGGNNIRTGFSFIDSSKDFCQKELKREPEDQEWLSCYQGSCKPHHRCKPTKMTARVENYAQCLSDAIMDGVSRDCEYIYIGNYSK